MGICYSQQNNFNPNYYLRDVPQKILKNIQGIRYPTESQFQELAYVLSESCIGDKDNSMEFEWKFLLKNIDIKRKKEIIQEQAKFFLTFALQYGLVYVTKQNGKITGVAIMYPPDSFSKGNLYTKYRVASVNFQLKKCGLFKISQSKNSEFIKKLKVYLKLTDKMHKQYAGDDHWFLQHVSVLPKYQRQGYGTQLLNLFNYFVYKYNVIGYLESNGAQNRQFFQKNGFRVVDKIIPNIDNKICKEVLNYDGGTSIMINEPWGTETNNTENGSIKGSDIVSV